MADDGRALNDPSRSDELLSLGSLRKSLIVVVGSHEVVSDPSSSREAVAAVLDVVVATSTTIHDEDDDSDDDDDDDDESRRDGVTPLMIACDRRLPHVVRYVERRARADRERTLRLFGRPSDAGSVDGCGGNGSVHLLLAAASGRRTIETLEALTSLEAFVAGGSLNDARLRLLSRTNANGDAPLMTAIAARPSGRDDDNEATVVAVLRHVLAAATKSDDDDRLRSVIGLRNDVGDSAASLALGHARRNALEFLLTEAGATIDGDDLVRCRRALARAEKLPRWAERTRRMRECLAVAEAAAETSARAAEQELERLLEEEEEEARTTSDKTKNTKTKKKKKKKKTRRTATRRTEDTEDTEDDAAAKSDSANNDHDERPVVSATTPQFVTLDDGDVVVAADDRCASRGPPPEHDGDEDAFDSLCLDPSMLLLSTHAMAITLSPAQLDAVKARLEEQLRAVDEARRTQDRVLGRNRRTE